MIPQKKCFLINSWLAFIAKVAPIYLYPPPPQRHKHVCEVFLK